MYNIKYVVEVTLKGQFMKFKPGIYPLLSSRTVYLHLTLLLLSCSFPLWHMQEDMYLFDIHMHCCNRSHPFIHSPNKRLLVYRVQCVFPPK